MLFNRVQGAHKRVNGRKQKVTLMNIKKKDSSEHLRQLVQQIEAQLGWGEGSTWTNKDFQELSERIFAHTRQQLSVTTLKRVWGRAERVANPSGATLDILAEFAGYGSWRAFRQQQSPTLPQNGSPPATPRSKRPWKMVSGSLFLTRAAESGVVRTAKPGNADQ